MIWLLLLQAGEFIPLEPGTFMMGEGEAPPKTKEEWKLREWDEAPAHRVHLKRAFSIAPWEVTNAQFRAFDPKHAGEGGDDSPAVRVSWTRAVEYAAWLSMKEGKAYRLPTEAEWEYARRAGHAIGTRIREWCLDWHGPYEAGEDADPSGPAQGYARVARGGKGVDRPSDRSGHLPDDANRLTGFRLVIGEPPFPGRSARPPERRPPAKPLEAPRTPYFLDFVKEKKAPPIPKDAWGPVYAAWNHFSAVCVCPNGDVLAAWYTCVSEEGRELAQAASRLPAGADSWDPPELFFDVPGVNDHAPVLLRANDRIYHFFTQSLRGWDDAADYVRVSTDSGFTWSAPRLVAPRGQLSQPCSAFVAKDGTLFLAADGDGHRDTRVVRSADGVTWEIGKGDLVKAGIHPAIAPRSDGAILAFLRGPKPMPMMVSTDKGDSWAAEKTPFAGISVGQKAAALRLASGNLLVLHHNSGVFAAISTDDGKTWPHVRKIPGLDGYLSAAQAPNGLIYAVGSKQSRVVFNEAWVKPP